MNFSFFLFISTFLVSFLHSHVIASQGKINNDIRSTSLNIVSLIDDTSVYSTFIKVYSIVKSSVAPSKLKFYFLLFRSNPVGDKLKSNVVITVDNFQTIFSNIFPFISAEFKFYRPSSFLQKYLRKTEFEKEIIFSRFLLPRIYSFLDRFLYLDNDLIVNCDLGSELGRYPLTKQNKEFLFASPDKEAIDTVDRGFDGINFRSRSSQSVFQSKKRKSSSSKIRRILSSLPVDYDLQGVRTLSTLSDRPANFKRNNGRSKEEAAVGMVFEYHPMYANYLNDHFNQSHPLYLRAKQKAEQLYSLSSRSKPSFASTSISKSTLFLNAGVILFNVRQWNRYNLTGLSEDIIASNYDGSIYSTSIGDQAVFYLLFFAFYEKFSSPIYSFLPAQFNMRRLPKKTLLMLEDNTRGELNFLFAVMC
jgi:lipopolysaccharide biosynthesis glycosyltransferase